MVASAGSPRVARHAGSSLAARLSRTVRLTVAAYVDGGPAGARSRGAARASTAGTSALRLTRPDRQAFVARRVGWRWCSGSASTTSSGGTAAAGALALLRGEIAFHPTRGDDVPRRLRRTYEVDVFVDLLVTEHGLAAAVRSDGTGVEALHASFLGAARPHRR